MLSNLKKPLLASCSFLDLPSDLVYLIARRLDPMSVSRLKATCTAMKGACIGFPKSTTTISFCYEGENRTIALLDDAARLIQYDIKSKNVYDVSHTISISGVRFSKTMPGEYDMSGHTLTVCRIPMTWLGSSCHRYWFSVNCNTYTVSILHDCLRKCLRCTKSAPDDHPCRVPFVMFYEGWKVMARLYPEMVPKRLVDLNPALVWEGVPEWYERALLDSRYPGFITRDMMLGWFIIR